MESRFGHDFGRVRIHADSTSASSAQALSAHSFTLGNDIYFGTGRYAPRTPSGRALLGHELAHVVQQVGSASSGVRIDESPEREREAEAAATEMVEGQGWARPGWTGAGGIQRKLVVDNPTGSPAGSPPGTTNAAIITTYLATLCPGFSVVAGEVAPTSGTFCPAGAAGSSAPEACGCFCEMHGLTDPVTGNPITWTIEVNDNEWPHTDPLTQTVSVQSPSSSMQFGSWAKGPPTHRVTTANWLVLGHEMCGHARLMAKGTHPTGPPATAGGRPSHDVTVGIENKIAKEHGIPTSDLRGLFADPHHGESFAKVTVAGFAFGSADLTALPAAEQRQLDVAAAFMTSTVAANADVIGHADKPAAVPAANMTISQQRAARVKAELVSRGIAPARFVTAKGVGDSECLLPGHQPGCRKVDIFIFIFKGASVTHP
jgi:outer membrane protein OmpA-like peptidoglycan-associated protein